jgi:HSP20 family molecular chaperone IbpA
MNPAAASIAFFKVEIEGVFVMVQSAPKLTEATPVTLTIRGEKQEETEENTKDRYVSERRYGSFRRSLPIPDSVDINKIEANFKSGVLTVTLPKSADAEKKQKTIPVSTK